jgi:hypothetical protein
MDGSDPLCYDSRNVEDTQFPYRTEKNVVISTCLDIKLQLYFEAQWGATWLFI